MERTFRKITRIHILFEAAAWLCLGIAFWFLLDRLDSGALSVTLFSSDALFHANLYQDIFRDEYELRGWTTPPGTFFFPDMLLLFPCMFLFKELVPALLAYALLQFSLLILSQIYLFRVLLPGAESVLSVRILTPFAGATILLLAGMELDLGVFQTLLLSAHHAGALIVSVFCLAILIRLLQGKNKTLSLVLLFILCTLGMASDSLFAVQFPLPAALTCVVFMNRETRTRMISISILLLATISTGVHGLKYFMREARWFISLDYNIVPGVLAGIRKNTTFIADCAHFFDLFAASLHPGLIGFWSIWFVVILSLSSWSLVDRWRKGEGAGGKEPPRHAFYLVFQVLLMFSNLGAALSVSVFADQAFAPRYLLPVYVAPFFTGVYLLVYFFRPANQDRLRRTVLPFLIAPIIVAATFISSSPLAFADYRPRIAVCIDAHAESYKLKYGLSDYWNAKPITLFSRKALRVYPVAEGYPHAKLRANNFLWYYGKEERPTPDFIVLDRLNRQVLLEKLGSPAHILYCDESEIFVYDRMQEPRVRDFYNNFLAELDIWRKVTGR
jgi:hypothetical protein